MKLQMAAILKEWNLTEFLQQIHVTLTQKIYMNINLYI